jgi:hypothetical protein
MIYTPDPEVLRAAYERVTTHPGTLRRWKKPLEDAYWWLLVLEGVQIEYAPDGNIDAVCFPDQARVGTDVRRVCTCKVNQHRCYCWHRAATRLLDTCRLMDTFSH